MKNPAIRDSFRLGGPTRPGRPAAPRHPSSTEGGFTIMELFIVLLIMGLIAGLAAPKLRTMMHRFKVEATLQEISMLSRTARFESIQRSRQTMLIADTTNNVLVAFEDTDANRVLDPGEEVIGRVTLPERIVLGGATTGAADDALPVLGFAGEDGPVFRTDGSVEAEGAIRIRDERQNFLEVRVAPAATAKIQLRKFLDASTVGSGDPLGGTKGKTTGAGWFTKGEDGRRWVWN